VYYALIIIVRFSTEVSDFPQPEKWGMGESVWTDRFMAVCSVHKSKFVWRSTSTWIILQRQYLYLVQIQRYLWHTAPPVRVR
jgi:hypothetical protein